MKILLFNGSNKPNGCTFTALSEAARTLNAEGIETEILQIGAKHIRDCIGCNGCVGKYRCVFDDDIVNEWIEKIKKQMVLYLEHLFIMRTLLVAFCRQWIGCSMRQVNI